LQIKFVLKFSVRNLILILQIPDGFQGQVMGVAILAAEGKSNIRGRGDAWGGKGGVGAAKAGLISYFGSNDFYVSSYTVLFSV